MVRCGIGRRFGLGALVREPARPVSARGGRSQHRRRGAPDGALIIDLSAIRAIRVDPARSIHVKVPGGALHLATGLDGSVSAEHAVGAAEITAFCAVRRTLDPGGIQPERTSPVKASLEHATVIVVGGSSGIGLACALQLHALGANVTVAGRDRGRLEAARTALGVGARTLQLDVTDEAAVADALGRYDRIDHLVVVAGSPFVAPVSAATDLQRGAMEVRFWGALYACRAAASKLAKTGSVTLCSGAAVVRPRPGRPVGVASGWAVEGLVRALGVEFRPVRVNAVAPGPTRTPTFERFFGADAPSTAESLAAQLPARRIGEADDIAHAIVFLMTNAYVTGVTLRVDGGYALA